MNDVVATDPWAALRRHTPARIALGRAGDGMPTAEVLRFAAAHAQARDAVQVPLDVPALCAALHADGWQTLPAASRAATRAVRASSSSRGFSSATSARRNLCDATTRSTTASTTASSTPRAAGALTPGATAAGSTSRQTVR